MDDIVKAALAKWPNVPHCYGWLALDARGQWFMRDDRVQAQGPFPQVKGSRIDHEKLLAFIHRNYEADAQGCWYFQNGPQRVYLELEATPWVWRLSRDDAPTANSTNNGAMAVTSHTGRTTTAAATYLDAQGRLFIDTPIGIGLVHTLDMHLAADEVQRGVWVPQDVDFAAMPGRFGFVRSPVGLRRVA